MEMDMEEEVEGEEGGDGTLRELYAIEFLTQGSEPSRTTLVDARNRFNELSLLVMMWTVRHHCLAGEILAFNCYRHWVQLLLHQSGEPPVTIMSQ